MPIYRQASYLIVKIKIKHIENNILVTLIKYHNVGTYLRGVPIQNIVTSEHYPSLAYPQY